MALQLNANALSRLDPARIGLPRYDREKVTPGVLHIGSGAFHRAHQAAYFDKLLASNPGFGIIGVSMRSSNVKEALAPQDGLYTLANLDENIHYRIIGSVVDVITADEATLSEFALSPDLKIITLTVTEKGYCLGSDGALDFNHPDISADRKNDAAARSAIGLIAHVLAARMTAGLAAPDIISCDNLSGNGAKLRAAVIAFSNERSGDLSRWIEGEVRFPNTMVDAITPATDDDLRRRIADEAGVIDAMPVQREAFADWVIQDTARHAGALRDAGAVIAADVAGFEVAKLRMLNGAHSTLAYRGLACGYDTVAQAMRDPAMCRFINDMMRDEIAPGICAPAGLDLDAYRAALLKRFQNPAIAHKLSQIAWDGSQKLPIRLFGAIVDNLRDKRPIDQLCIGVAAWMRFVVRAARAGRDIVDPEKECLMGIGRACQDNSDRDTELFLETAGIFPPDLTIKSQFKKALVKAYLAILDDERSERKCA